MEIKEKEVLEARCMNCNTCIESEKILDKCPNCWFKDTLLYGKKPHKIRV